MYCFIFFGFFVCLFVKHYMVGVRETYRFPDNETMLVTSDTGLLVFNVSGWERGLQPWQLPNLSNRMSIDKTTAH